MATPTRNVVTTVPDKAPSLQMYYPHLSAKERALICRALNEWRVNEANNDPGATAHLGLLPFFSMKRVANALSWKAAEATEYRRMWATLCSKVEAHRWLYKEMPTHMTVELNLNSAAVHKHFGARPDLGVHLPTIPRKETRGPLHWNIAKKEWVPEKIYAAPRISLVKLRRSQHSKHVDVWQLHVPSKYYELAINWFMDHCSELT